MTVWKLFQSSVRNSQKPANMADKLTQRQTKFRFGYEELYAQYTLAQWMTQNTLNPDHMQTNWPLHANKTHAELNYIFGTRSYARCLLFCVSMYLLGIYIGKPRFDWQDSHDPKFEQKTYGDLEEGGDEGGDDD